MAAAHDITYAPLPADDPIANEALDLAAQVFHASEPLSAAAGVPPAGLRRLMEILQQQLCGNGLSVVALARGADGKETVAGVGLAKDFAAEPDGAAMEALVAGEPSLQVVFGMLDAAEEYFKEHRGSFCAAPSREGGVCHMFIIAVNPEYQGRGIASQLSAAMLAGAKRLDYTVSFAECTGEYSLAACKKSGMRVVKEWPYATWQPEGFDAPPFAGVPAPHTATRLVVIEHP